MTDRIGRVASAASCVLVLATLATGTVAAAAPEDGATVSPGPRALDGRPRNTPRAQVRERSSRRPFETPPGLAAGAARDAAPGQLRKRDPVERPEPTGGVLPATPPAPAGQGAPRSVSGAASRPPTARDPAFGEVIGAPSTQRATTVRRPAAVDAGGARGGVVFGGVLGAVPAVARRGPESAPGVADPVAPDAIAPAFLLFVLAAQVIVAAAWLPFARRMLGGFGTRRLR